MQEPIKLIPMNSFVLPAYLDWMEANSFTPHIIVDSKVKDTVVPMEYVNDDGFITLNVRTTAVAKFHIDQDILSFSARFSGVETDIYIPVSAIKGVIAKENGLAIPMPEMEASDADVVETKPKRKRPILTVSK
ncbi:Stringent starvation protein B [Vibrio chagasii]|nr:Stringent starvation protein B [Vibrio chagasii]